MAKINDRRVDTIQPWGFVVCTDAFMSGWGEAKGGRSLYALAVDSPDEAAVVMQNGRLRHDMRRGRLVAKLPRLKPRDHLTVVDKYSAARWYEPGGFAH